VIRSRLAAVCLVAAVALGCGSGGSGLVPGQSAAGVAAAPSATWTFLIYMATDNNLEAQKMAIQMAGAAKVPSNQAVNVIALIDRTPDDTSSPSAPDGPLGSIPAFTDTKLLKIENGDYRVLQELGEADMGDPQTLAWFLRTSITQYPAKHYSLIIGDHGGGITGAAWDDSTPKDAAGRSSNLTVPEMSAAIKAGLNGTGVDKLDFIGYDACLMGTYDTALSLAPYAQWLVANEEVSLTNTWDYGAALTAIQGKANPTGEEVGRAIIDRTVDPGWPIGTTSMIDLAGMGRVQQAVESFAGALTREMPQVASELGRQRAQTLEFGIDPNTKENLGYSLVDLGDLTARLGNVPPAVNTARSAVNAAIKGVAVYVKSGPAAANASGMAIYFPQSSQNYNSAFDALSTSGPWRTMLAAYFKAAGGGGGGGGGNGGGGGGTTTTGPQFTTAEARLALSQGGVTVSADLAPATAASVVSAQLLSGIIATDGTIHHLLVSPAFIGAGGATTVAGTWNFGFAALSDGRTTLESSLILTPASGVVRAMIPLLYQGPGGAQQNIALQFTLDGKTGQITDQPRYVVYDKNGAVGELTPAAGSIVAPLVLVSAPGGKPSLQLVSSTAIETAKLSFQFVRLQSGTPYQVTLVAADAANHDATAIGLGLVP
jgi:hypothetical protein